MTAESGVLVDAIGSNRTQPYWFDRWLEELDAVRDELTPAEYVCLVEFTRSCNSRGETFVGAEALAKATGFSKNAANTALAKVERFGLVVKRGWKVHRSWARAVVLARDDVNVWRHRHIEGIRAWIKECRKTPAPVDWSWIDPDINPPW